MNIQTPPPAAKFSDPEITAGGEVRAEVALTGLETLWFNTGTLCNIECTRCYIESSPTNDRLVYLSAAETAAYLDEAEAMGAPLREIGFTGGEPFMNPEMIAMLETALARGYAVLVLTNAMRPMMRPRVLAGLADLVTRYGDRLTLRVSLDHHAPFHHDEERGAGAFEASLVGMRALRDMGARMAVAGRTIWGESLEDARRGYAALFEAEGFAIDAADPSALVLFPEMDEAGDPPEITESCWGILDKSPDSVMCASARMVVKRKGAATPTVAACTLLPYAPEFDLGATLAEASRPVKLNHPHCATFCVLGGASCSG
ncbi:radical SAM protein [Rhodovulum sp. DZ06]|uniref:radical SAM protein n=1 Tax=Rhodovulum sp. DZ06 TaxID=3425126 RepID=UPI003D328BB5